MSLCLFQSIEPKISINQKSWIIFFKNWFWLVQTHFSKVFQTFLSLSPNWTRLNINFLSLSSILFARRSSPKADKIIIPFLLHLFSCFMHKFMHYFGFLGPMHILGFLMIQALFCEIDHWVFVLQCYKHDLWCLIWSIWCFVRNSKF